MTIDEYFEQVQNAVDVCARDSISNQDYVEYLISNNSKKTREIIEIRKELLCSSDYQNLGGYLEIGFFTEFDPSERVALFSFMFEIGNDLKIKLLRNSFEKYEINQPLFSGDQELFKSEEDGTFFIICIVAKRSNWARGIGDGVFFKFLWGMLSVKPMRRGPGRSGVLASGIVENPCYAGAKSD
ncbi:MAG TPA: hypothetical protein VN367_07735 [Chlorobaculum sp.]|nr:hypothetical protein [Chlorobaculum sp.]